MLSSLKIFPGYKFILIVIGITIDGIFGLIFCQIDTPLEITNETYDTNIHTVEINSAEWQFGLPVIVLNSGQQLELRFDEFSSERHSYNYTFVHCDLNWKPSELSKQEYLSGFGSGLIRQVEPSFNTTYEYFNYRLKFPEEDCIPLKSGNYGLIVYDETDNYRIILTHRFFVTENSVNIEASVKQPLFSSTKEEEQHVQLKLSNYLNEIRDPTRDLRVVILQNNRFDNYIILNEPYSITPGVLNFNDPDKGIFKAGNEFRSVDLKSIRYQTGNISSIQYVSSNYHFYMKSDQRRSGKPYFYKADLNGSFYIDIEKAQNKNTDADYVYVHFNLTLPLLYAEEDIYVTGEFCNWIYDEKNKMKFNDEKGCFELTLLLKQGLYDYCFAKADPESGKINEYDIEGSYYETENDYSVLVYFHDNNLRYDRLLGYFPINK